MAAIVAIVVLGIYIYALVDSWGSTGEAAEAWARRLSILGGVEALAFAAAGWLFGREVSRQAIEQADKRADEANAKATNEQQKAEQAMADALTLAGAVETTGTRQGLDADQRHAGLINDVRRRYGVAGSS